MTTYGIAVEFWLLVASAGFLLSMSALVVRETRCAIDLPKGSSDEAPSSRSHASAPSHPGF